MYGRPCDTIRPQKRILPEQHDDSKIERLGIVCTGRFAAWRPIRGHEATEAGWIVPGSEIVEPGLLSIAGELAGEEAWRAPQSYI